MRQAVVAAAVISLFLLSSDVRAQSTLSAADVRSAYERLDFDDALKLAEHIVANAESYAPRTLVDVHTVMALILISRGDRSASRAHFSAALSLDPQLRLDSSAASPEVIEFFESVKAQHVDSEPAPVGIRYIPVSDPRASAAFRSMLVPGWGQMYKGQTKRGAIMMGVWGLAAAGTVTAHFIRKDRRRLYVDETNPALVPDRFDDFNRWHKLRNNLALATAVVWAVSYLDALIVGGPTPGTDYTGRRSVSLNFSPRAPLGGPQVLLTIPLGPRAHELRTP